MGCEPGPSSSRERRQRGVRLRVAVLGRLDDLGVEPERHVVHEHVAVHLGEIHGPLDRVVERVERAHDVVAVDPEVEGEVVPRPGRDHDHGDAALGGDARDERL